jgi:hypothetical protein
VIKSKIDMGTLLCLRAVAKSLHEGGNLAIMPSARNSSGMTIFRSPSTWCLYSESSKLIELKTHSTLLGACTSCPLLRSDLEASAIEIKDLKHKLDHSSHYTILFPPCEACVSLKGKLFYATKENTELQQEVVYLTARLEKTILSEKMVEEDLSRG